MSRSDTAADRDALLEFAEKVRDASVGHSCAVLASLQADARQVIAYVNDEDPDEEEVK